MCQAQRHIVNSIVAKGQFGQICVTISDVASNDNTIAVFYSQTPMRMVVVAVI